MATFINWDWAVATCMGTKRRLHFSIRKSFSIFSSFRVVSEISPYNSSRPESYQLIKLWRKHGKNYFTCSIFAKLSSRVCKKRNVCSSIVTHDLFFLKLSEESSTCCQNWPIGSFPIRNNLFGYLSSVWIWRLPFQAFVKASGSCPIVKFVITPNLKKNSRSPLLNQFIIFKISP